jgi:hypothetical protein
MSKNRKKIVQAIQGLSAPAEYTVMSGYVKAVHEDKATMDIVLNISGQVLEGVMLHGLPDSLKGIVIIPEQDSDVVICSVDGSGEYMLLKCDKVKKVMWDISTEINVKCDKIIFNGGDNGGVPIVNNISDKLNHLEQDLNSIKQVFSAWTPVYESSLKSSLSTWYGQQIQQTESSDLENNKILH